MPYKQGIRDAKSTRATAPTVVWNGRGAALESGDDFTTSLKISLLEEPVCPKRRVPREGTGAEGQGDRPPSPAARRGPAGAPLRQKFAPSPRQMTGTASHPRRRRDHPPPRSRLQSPLVHFQDRSGRPFTPALQGGHRSRPTAAVPPRGAPPRDAFIVP